MKTSSRSIVCLLLLVVAGCSSDGGSKCSNENGTELADTDWPKFRRDLANTGRTEAAVVDSPANGRRLFPAAGERVGSIASTPILGTDMIILTSADGNVYVLDRRGVTQLDQPIETPGAITATPLLGADGTLFVASGDGSLRQYRPDGTIRRQTGLGGFLAASPTLANKGTVYQGSTNGAFGGICANGVSRFAIVGAPVRASAAIAPDEQSNQPDESLVLFATDTGQVRAVDFKGRERWTLFGAAPVNSAIVVDESAGRVFVMDDSGRVTAAAVGSGRPDPEFRFRAAAPASASLALGRDDTEAPSLYVVDEGGTLYAVERTRGTIRWTFQAGSSIRSSPAVTSSGGTDSVIFGADDGLVYAVADGGDAPILLWTFDTGAPIGTSSPSIAADGTVYIGTEDRGEGGALYAIGPA